MAIKKEEAFKQVDIQENYILDIYGEAVFKRLLRDHTSSISCLKDDGGCSNIIWATNNYDSLGDGYHFYDEITIERITRENGGVIKPRVIKNRDEQKQRSRDKAEVFTPSWVCNKQNNLIDEAWFGRKNVFNTEIDNPDGTHTWTATEGNIEFPNSLGKTWKDYVEEKRLEITCGEAPYLVSRYDVTSSLIINVVDRIGLLDRKLRIVNENTPSERTKTNLRYWQRWTQRAFASIYGYEWQGDNLLIARESLLFTYIDNYFHKWNKYPRKNSLKKIATIISCNLWQMDGLKCGIPGYLPKELLPNSEQKIIQFNEDDKVHPRERLCRIIEWEDVENLKGKEIVFKSLIANH